ncbi:hypothetical protein POM88_042414 [Heracleum sosnowskyi]|uniref:Uncharacterized protein n=1 Tax=Heracleum sosnowskyi TaxID=360622 RepID=A0AAD8HID2_9APIA|nr:hypothetical protein POM88_042414 [Heracleum sosnowskyi]
MKRKMKVSKRRKKMIVEKSSSSAVEKEACLFKFDMSSEEDSEEDKKHIRRSPVFIKTFCDQINLEAYGLKVKKQEAEQESDEELLLDRYEVDHGYKYVLKKRWKAVTNLINPERTYYKSGIDSGCTKHVLHDPEYPLATFSKLAIKTYNDIQGTEYEYVGVVKAYMRFIGGWHFWIRFKACVVGQDAINFQANIYQDFPNRETNVVPVCVEFVHPLPPCGCQISAF